MYKKQFHEMKKKKNELNKENNNNNNNDDIDNLIIRNEQIMEHKEDNEDNNPDSGLKEQLIDTSSKSNNSKAKSYENEGNSLEVSYGGNLALTTKQKDMINTIEKELEKRNELSNFDDINHLMMKALN